MEGKSAKAKVWRKNINYLNEWSLKWWGYHGTFKCLEESQKEVPLILFTITKQQQSSNMNQKWHLLWQFTVRDIENKTRSHWHKECPNDCTEVALQMAFLANHQITSDCSWQQCTISGTNLTDVWSRKKCTSPKNSTLQNIKLYTSSIQYFLWCQWLLRLSRYSLQLYEKYSLLQSSSEWHSRL